MKKPTKIIARYETVCYHCKRDCKGQEIISEAGKWVHALKCYDEFRDMNTQRKAVIGNCIKAIEAIKEEDTQLSLV